MPDRSPEPADEREWTLETVPFYLGAARLIDPTRPSANNGELTVVVPKSRLESAMAAADERERELDGALTQAVTMANDLGGEVKDLTEALRRLVAASRRAAAALPENHPEQTLLLLAADRARSLLPVPVEGEPEEEN